MGASALCHCTRFAVWDLLRDEGEVGSPAVLFPAASGQRQPVHVHIAALDVPHLLERWYRLEGDEVSTGGVARGVDVRKATSDFGRVQVFPVHNSTSRLSMFREHVRILALRIVFWARSMVIGLILAQGGLPKCVPVRCVPFDADSAIGYAS